MGLADRALTSVRAVACHWLLARGTGVLALWAVLFPLVYLY